MSKLESRYQAKLIKKLKRLFPDCMVFKMDPNYIQGIPDLLVLYEDKWAMLEVKRSEDELDDPRPNQGYYVRKLDKMSFASFIFPENEEEVLDDLELAFKGRSRRRSRSARG